MADMGDIRRGLAANLESILGIQVSPYILSNPTPPSAYVVPAPIEYDQTMGRGIDLHNMNVRVFVGTASDIGAQKKLDEYMNGGPGGVKAAVESDLTLGGAAHKLRVTRCSAPQLMPVDNGGVLLFAEWDVEVYAEGA